MPNVTLAGYLNMIELKTSVLLAASLKMGAIMGGAGGGNQEHIAEFGKNLGLAFQIQDDYLDAFGDPAKFGKQVGGDILANKKTFLFIKAMEVATPGQQKQMQQLLGSDGQDKVPQMISIFASCGVDQEARVLMDSYLQKSYQHLDDIAVLSNRKGPLLKLAEFLVKRDF